MIKKSWNLRTDDVRNWPGLNALVMEHLNGLGVRSKDRNMAEGRDLGSGLDAEIKDVVCRVLEGQYGELGLEKPEGLRKFRGSGARTVTTGHQLQLGGGPAFLHYKTITTIRLARKLEEETGGTVVPVFWLATEDHDFEEVSWVHGEKSKYIWDSPMKHGKVPVGRLPLDGVEDVIREWLGEIYEGCDGTELLKDKLEIEEALMISLRNGESYGKLFRRWMHIWYGDTDLVVIDADDSDLKQLGVGIWSKEFEGEGIAGAVSRASENLRSRGFKAQAHIREVNLFYLQKGVARVGIVKEGEVFKAGDTVLNTENLDWPDWCRENAENLSPGALLRPFYQELILPNYSVILGPGELSYWKQLEDAFKAKNMFMPDLHLRDHVLVVDHEVLTSAQEVGWSLEKGWWTADEWVRSWIDTILEQDLRAVNEALLTVENSTISLAKSIDPTLEGAAAAGSASMQKVWDGLQKKFRKAIRRQNPLKVEALIKSASKLSINRTPQDRFANFHVLSIRLGGFKVLRNLLLDYSDNSNASNASNSVMHVLEESQD